MHGTPTLLPLLALAACGGGAPGSGGTPAGDDTACADYAAASVELTVVDEAGAPVEDATASYTLAGEDWFAPEPCHAVDAGVFVCGWELRGTLEITVEAEGRLSEYLEVTVDGGPCHVETEQVTVTLQPAG